MPLLREEIKTQLATLYLLNTREIDDLLVELDRLPEKALREILKTVKDAKKDQKKLFFYLNRIDPRFTKNLEVFLDGNCNVQIADAMISKFT